ncbi:MAG: hemolysin family protein [Candidatus Brocadiaceae bacterium]
MPALWALIFVTALIEAALHHLSWSKLEDELVDPAARERYERYTADPRRLAGLCLVIRALATVGMVVLIAHGARDGALPLAGALVAAAGLLAVAELLARFIGRRWSAGVLRIVLPPLYWVSYPIRVFHSPGETEAAAEDEPEPEVVEAAKEEIRVALEDGTAEGALEAEQKQMIEGILKFRQVDVAQIMTPRTEIESVEAGLPLARALQTFESFHHSRIPVFEGSLDSVVGIVYVRDLLAAARHEDAGEKTLRDVMREPFFVPETMRLRPLLHAFQQQHVQIAVVLDEYGGVSGVVTVEDIMEEIVGEIEDEYDEEDQENRIHVRSGGGIVADGRVRIDELNGTFGFAIPEDEGYDTIGGFVTSCFARVPEPGEECHTDGLLIRVLQSDPRRVGQVFIQREQRPADQ